MRTHLDWPVTEEPDLAAEYDRYADVYDMFFHARGEDLDFYTNRIREILTPGGELLELGTGTGRVAERLTGAGFRVTGVDFSRGMLEKAFERQQRIGDRFTPLYADVRTLALGRRFPLIIAPFGMMAHLLRDEDRQETMRRVFDHLEPGGTFIFDDMPAWLAGPATGEQTEIVGMAQDPATGLGIRATSVAIDIADAPLTLCFHFLDWLRENKLVKRVSVKVLFRNTALEDEVQWLRDAGFLNIALIGGFDCRPFDAADMKNNSRLIIQCSRPAVEKP